MTADDLRALVRRHAFCAQDYRDIRDLVSLVGRLARPNHETDCAMTGCHWCSVDRNLRHAEDCPAPALEGLISQGAKP